MLFWTRNTGQKVVIGDDIVLVVKSVMNSHGDKIKGASVSLGFDLPKGVRVQRGETYENVMKTPFPVFYRLRSRMNNKVRGYSWTLPGEVDFHEEGFDYEQISGFDDMRDDDDPVSIYIFRSEAETLAFMEGLKIGDRKDDKGATHTKYDNVWLVLVHQYYGDRQGPNPEIRNRINSFDRVKSILSNKKVA